MEKGLHWRFGVFLPSVILAVILSLPALAGAQMEPVPPAPAADFVRAKGYGIEPQDASMTSAEKALMAKRAAKVDALRNLAEQVRGVRITSDSYVRDFITQSDEIRARVNTFIQGAKVVSERQMPDGSYEVEVEAELEPLRRDLFQIRRDDMLKMRAGVILAVCLVMTVAACSAQQVAPEPGADWIPVRISAKGAGAPPATAVNQAQARLMAERAAKVDALRNLLEQAYGVTISSSTTVRNFITENDTIRARVDAYIKGARIVDTRYLSDGSAEVEMEISLDYEFRGSSREAFSRKTCIDCRVGFPRGALPADRSC